MKKTLKTRLIAISKNNYISYICNYYLVLSFLLFACLFLSIFLTSYYVTENTFIDEIVRIKDRTTQTSPLFVDVVSLKASLVTEEQQTLHMSLQIISLIFALISFILLSIITIFNLYFYRKNKVQFKQSIKEVKYKYVSIFTCVFNKINWVVNIFSIWLIKKNRKNMKKIKK